MPLLNYLKTNQNNIQNTIESYKNTIKLCQTKMDTYYPHINKNTSFRTQYTIAENDIKNANTNIISNLEVLEVLKDKIEYINKIKNHENIIMILNEENEIQYKLIKRVVDIQEDIASQLIQSKNLIDSQQKQIILMSSIVICVNMLIIFKIFK
jgi:hypothetical protein